MIVACGVLLVDPVKALSWKEKPTDIDPCEWGALRIPIPIKTRRNPRSRHISLLRTLEDGNQCRTCLIITSLRLSSPHISSDAQTMIKQWTLQTATTKQSHRHTVNEKAVNTAQKVWLLYVLLPQSNSIDTHAAIKQRTPPKMFISATQTHKP